ncbi:hypothetical protein BBF96_01910 [Anoxybacter fermentans]|uniref:Fibronectin type-III domain-containing protein n=1 Tax=Anoxybacter fermentans TaxID=1323375 RepID=A0A3Q9HP42_9FIRM|nr:RHS repeat protein [Anoxybacter fermentans]AZR72260.1 hypothetical protein BBF96_01910 [Anoxybacter fermentans]
MKKGTLHLLIIMVLMIVGLVGHIEAAFQPPSGLVLPSVVEVENPENILSFEALFDQDVLTQPILLNGNVEYIYFKFDQGINPDVVKFYIIENSNCSFSLEYLTEDGGWSSVAELNLINGNQMNSGWNRYPISLDHLVNQFRLRIERYSKTDQIGIGEIEFWGQTSQGIPLKTKEYKMVEDEILEFHGGSGPQGTPEPKSVHVKIDVPIRYVEKAELIYDIYDLESYVEGFWQINEGGYHYLTPLGALNTWTTAIEEIDPTLLIQGENKITFKVGNNKKNGFKITNVRLKLYYDNGERTIKQVEGSGNNEQLLSNLIDGDLSTYWETDWQVYDQVVLTFHLPEKTGVEYVTWLQECEFVDSIRIEYLSSGGWELFAPELTEKDLIEGWNVIQTNQAVETDQIRFVLLNPRKKHLIGPIYEVIVWGSKIKSRKLKPDLIISYPGNGDVVKIQSLVKGFVRGDYDRIEINGEQVTVENNYFETEVKLDKESTEENFRRTIVVEAIRDESVVNVDQVDVYLQPTPLVTITSPEDGYLTNAEEALIEGETDLPSHDLYINGNWFSTGSRNFQAYYALEEGINQITIEAVAQRGLSDSETIYVRRDSQPPIIYFNEDYNSLVLNESLNYYPIEGYIEDYSQCRLYVNGIEVDLQDEYFSYSAQLHPGYNYFTFRVVDELNQEISTEICLVQDSTPPNPFVPEADPAGWSQVTQPVISFFTTDDQSGMNHYEISIDGGEYVEAESPYTLPVLSDGIHTIRVKAVDNVGLSTAGTVKVYVDTTPPEQFIPTAEPADWSQVTQPVISFTTTDKHSGINHYELKVDDGEYITVESPYTLPELEDGVHTVYVKAVDNVGLETVTTVQVFVDTTPPEPFTPVADPAGWSQNTQPVITFATTDKASGINHYELQIDDGEFITVESPYKLPVLSDGIHEITVKAIDNVGLETIGKTKVYVDTTSPAVPKDFEVNPGDGEIVVKWAANTEWDLVEYRLYREPAWNDGNVRIIEPLEEPDYIDQEVVNGNEYTYYLVAVDHVENISDATEALTEKAGIAKVEINPAEGGEVEYGREVAINIPAEAMEEEGIIQVTVAEDEEIPETTKTVVSKTYKLEVIDENGEIKETDFKKEISIAVSYNEEQIPEGYTEFDLDVYYYNEADGLWVVMPKVEVDIVSNKVIITSTHFSMYNVQVTENYSPAADEYKDLGIAPYGTYFKNNQEYVSPSSGALNVNTVDVNLPGRNGFDLKLGRIYNSNQAVWDVLVKKTSLYAGFGNGWRWNIARIEDNDHGQYIYLEDGTAIKCEWKKGKSNHGYRKNTFEYHKGHHFIAIKKQQKGLFFWNDVGYEIYFKDGTKYEFDESGRLVRMIDRTGQNEINFVYSGNELKSITDTLQRKITFQYYNGRVTAIFVNGKEFVTYGYTDGRLTSVKDRMNRITSYDYDEYTFKTGYYAEYTVRVDYVDENRKDVSEKIVEDKVKVIKIPLLTEINYPTGGISKYSYSISSGVRVNSIDDVISGVDNEGYKYEIKYDGYVRRYYLSRKLQVKNQVQYLSATDIEGINPMNYSFVYEGDRIIKAIVEQLYQRIEMEFNEDGLNTEKRIYDIKGNTDGVLVVKEQYDYNDQKAIIEERVYHGYQTIPSYIQKFDYDNWGNKIYHYNSESGAEFYYHYLNTDSKGITDVEFMKYDESQVAVNGRIHNLLADQFVLNYDSVSNRFVPQQTHYHYDSKGNLITVARRHGNKWVKTRYEYDIYGNVTRIIDPLNNVTDKIYDSVHNAFLVKVIKDAGKDADGILQERIVTQYGYDAWFEDMGNRPGWCFNRIWL